MAEEFFEILFEGDQIKQRAPGHDLDQQVDVAIRPRVTTTIDPNTRTLRAPWCVASSRSAVDGIGIGGQGG